MAAVIALSILTACSSSTKTAARSTTTATTPTTAAGLIDLRSLIFQQLPATYIEEPAGVGVDGPLDLLGAAKAQSSTNAAAVQADLVREGFLRGYERGWVIKAGTTEFLNCWVLLFATRLQAAAYFNLINFDAKVAPNISTFPTPGLANSSGFVVPFTLAQGPQVDHTIDLVAGRLYFHLGLSGPPGTFTANDILTIAQSQRARATALGYP